MAARKKKLLKTADEQDVDVEHIVEALRRVKNPTVRYFLSMMIDALTVDLAEIEAGRPPIMMTRTRSN